jgi:hypothetical protein
MGRSKDAKLIEIIHSSKEKWDKFYKLVDKLIAQGYNKTDEEEDEEEGLDHEMISQTITVSLKPPNYDLPLVKLEGKEIFGRYDYEAESFEEWDNSAFELNAFKKGAGTDSFKDRWEKFELG